MGTVPVVGIRVFRVGETVVTERLKIRKGGGPETHVFEPQMPRRKSGGSGSITNVDNSTDVNMSLGRKGWRTSEM